MPSYWTRLGKGLSRVARPARYAAIDVGSNTIHLLLASCTVPAAPRQLRRRREFVQLGLDVAAQGFIGAERMELAARTLEGQVEDARQYGSRALAVGATEALRAAHNGGLVAEALAARAGLEEVRVLPAQVEAQLAFDGATMSLSAGVAALVLDIGGASSQVAFGPAHGLCSDHSLAIGSGMVTALADSDPPTDDEWRAMERLVAESIPDLMPPPPGTVGLGTGGTITNLPRLLGKGKGALLRPRDVEQVIELFRVTPVAILAERFRMDLERVRLCRGGALILAQLMDLLQLSRLRCSERGLRDGMVMALARRGPDWWRGRGEGGLGGAQPVPPEMVSSHA
jgi:exopolyphosphatase/guanosine-5'-triphosphate,3'-diphosphate pyrophosphatase